ncbi:MAG: TonB-dependent receptor [Williamsia sp.]|nr:TonB-dependent receptor [Williamsia sp.]
MRHNFIIFTLLLLFAVSAARAQTGNGTVSGSVKDGTGKPIEGASIRLLQLPDSTVVKTLLSDKQGRFEAGKISPNNYILAVSFVGFQTFYSKTLKMDAAHPETRLDDLRLQKQNSILQEVTVTGKRPPIEIKADRTVVNVEASVTNTGATALEVLEKSPGVSVDKDGRISLNGKQGVLVMIDGKPSYLAGADLTNLLSSMNANQLDQIEIMLNPPAKYDAAGNPGIINIKTKKNKAAGFNGNLTLGYGQGRYFKTNNSLNLNYRNKLLNLFVNYSTNANKNFNDLHIIRTYTGADGKTPVAFFDQPTYATFKGVNNNLKAGIDFTLSPKTTAGFVATGFIAPRESHNSSAGSLKDAGAKTDSVITTVSDQNSSWKNGSLNLNLSHRFDSLRDFTANVDFITYDRNDRQFYINNSYDAANILRVHEELNAMLPSDIQIYSGKIDYTRLIKGGKWEAGLKSSLVQTDNMANYASREGGISKPDYEKSNHFVYDEWIQAAYLNFNKQVKKWSLQTGLRFENTQYKGHQLGNPQKPDSAFTRSYTNLFPTTYLSYQANKNNQFTFSYGRRIDRPAYQDLNPFIFYINKYTYQQGNPFLGPQYTDKIQLSHVFKGMFTTSVEYSHVGRYITQVFRTIGEVTNLTQGNLGKVDNLSLAATAQLTPLTWWSSNLNANLNYRKVNGFANGDAIRTENINGQLNINNQFSFKKGWAGELSGFYNSPSKDGQFKIGGFGQVAAGISKQLFGNKATAKVSVRDLFYTQKIDGHIYYQNVHEHFLQSRDSRVLNFTFSYRFGKPLKEAAKKNNAPSEEQRRVQAG